MVVEQVFKLLLSHPSNSHKAHKTGKPEPAHGIKAFQ
jgi:hypothetical protein